VHCAPFKLYIDFRPTRVAISDIETEMISHKRDAETEPEQEKKV